MADDSQSFWIALARYSHIAFVLPVATFVGWILGALLDKWLHTQWLFLVGVIVGVIAGFVDLIRTVTAPEKDSGE